MRAFRAPIPPTSRKPPSETTPAYSRTASRVIRIDPALTARASYRLSITSIWPGGHVSTATRCGWSASQKTSRPLRSSRAGTYRSVNARPTISSLLVLQSIRLESTGFANRACRVALQSRPLRCATEITSVFGQNVCVAHGSPIKGCRVRLPCARTSFRENQVLAFVRLRNMSRRHVALPPLKATNQRCPRFLAMQRKKRCKGWNKMGLSRLSDCHAPL